VNFDRVAPYYRWLETLVFGRRLQEARVAFLGDIKKPRRVLVVGEGNGRFLSEFVMAHPDAAVDCVEASGRMIELARRRVGTASVHFIHGDIREVELQPDTYDLLVTHFFLDCFDEQSLAAVVAKLSRPAAPNAQWLIADFCEPAGDWRHMGRRFLIAFMYFFFRLVSAIEARHLVDYRPFLETAGFHLMETALPSDKMIRSERWERVLPSG
jgi:ubiquinone/menaquinone biosynthesis C-methylase UbiE